MKIMLILSNDDQVTAGSQAKIDLAVKLGADTGVCLIITLSSLNIITIMIIFVIIIVVITIQVNYKEEDFKEATDKWTNGRGVNIILDCIGGRFTTYMYAIYFSGQDQSNETPCI